MVSMSVSISEGDVAKFNDALKQYATALGDEISTAPRRAAIQICKSFRAASATLKAPKYARSSEYTLTKSKDKPKWITKDGVAKRRWHVDRPIRGKSYDVFVERKGDIRKKYLLLHHAGLARKSWGWVMHNIFKGSAPDAPWQKRKRDVRNPKDATKESTSRESRGVMTSSGFARICNRIDYITAALKVSQDEVLTKATNWMLKQVELRKPKL